MSKKVHNFSQSKNTGDAGESAIQPALQKRCHRIVDITDDREYWEYDVDYICIDEELNTELIELKTDTYTDRNGNIFIETVSNDSTDKKGWYYITEADVLWYYALPSTIYEFDMEELRQEIGESPSEYCDEAETKTIWNADYNSQGVTIPLESIPKRLYTERQVPQE